MVVLIAVHGLIHMVGVAKGFGWTEVTELDEPVSTAEGVAWLARGPSTARPPGSRFHRVERLTIQCDQSGQVGRSPITTQW